MSSRTNENVRVKRRSMIMIREEKEKRQQRAIKERPRKIEENI